ncbi:hypothetical protein GX50_07122 [[Emmonsia] crescens]|uniref:Uncharacterized protein n=1 Tax=[Emmonsia] crescens TaxID=73230 RepID=A0A2B7ZAR4_9EURO|nr:hypothetical protein GX50_07122 [Emmonsia crescens]
MTECQKLKRSWRIDNWSHQMPITLLVMQHRIPSVEHGDGVLQLTTECLPGRKPVNTEARIIQRAETGVKLLANEHVKRNQLGGLASLPQRRTSPQHLEIIHPWHQIRSSVHRRISITATPIPTASRVGKCGAGCSLNLLAL